MTTWMERSKHTPSAKTRATSPSYRRTYFEGKDSKLIQPSLINGITTLSAWKLNSQRREKISKANKHS